MKAKSADELRKWLDVPYEELKAILSKHMYGSDGETMESHVALALAEIEAVAHVTYEKEPEKV